MGDEIFMPIPGFEGRYEVSNFGNVRSLERRAITVKGNQVWPGKTLKRFDGGKGYPSVNLSDGKKAKKYTVHRLVLRTFVGEPESGQEACHFDGCRENARLDNLRWDTQKNNASDKIRHGTQLIGEKNKRAKLRIPDIQLILSSSESSVSLGRKFNVASSTIRAVRIGQNWRAA